MNEYKNSHEKENYKDKPYNSYDSSKYSDHKQDMKYNDHGSDYGEDIYKKPYDKKDRYGVPYYKDNQNKRYNPY